MTKHSIVALMALPFLMASCGGNPDNGANQGAALSPEQEAQLSAEIEQSIGTKARAIFKPLPASADNPDNPLTEAKVKLGKVLYFDKRLSLDGTQSCNTCHSLSTFGVDNKRFSEGDQAGKIGDRNSPTVLNAALHSSQFWDGRAKDVEEQAGMPILNPVEMAIPSEEFLVKRLSEIDLYKKLFAEAFPGEKSPLSYKNLQKAIGAFERTLLTPSKFDDYLNGNVSALNLAEKQGLQTFLDVGCNTCHSGSLLGGNMFQKFGVHFDYWLFTKSSPVDDGRFKVTGNEADKYMFKVPSLRNVSKTAPYFHDGSVADLSEAVKIISKVNLNRTLTDAEAASIVTFLESLTGQLPAGAADEPSELVGAAM